IASRFYTTRLRRSIHEIPDDKSLRDFIQRGCAARYTKFPMTSRFAILYNAAAPLDTRNSQ
ncbi:MAG: hypothetical protein PVG99_10305, partial [Desulfobacteraceae bacterium]